MSLIRPSSHGRVRGLTLLEVLVGLAILTADVLSIAAIVPHTLKANAQAEILTVAASLAQMKAEEIRRDDDRQGHMVRAIRALSVPTEPIGFLHEPRLSYSFCGQSMLYPLSSADTIGTTDTTRIDPRGQPGVARVIIRYESTYRPSQDVVYELRFN